MVSATAIGIVMRKIVYFKEMDWAGLNAMTLNPLVPFIFFRCGHRCSIHSGYPGE